MLNFLQTYHPKAILLSLGPINIYWYGLLMVIGVIGGVLIVWQLAKFYRIKKEHLFDLVFYSLIFGLLGARIYYVAYLWDYYSKNWLDILKIWQGGLAIHGIIIGGFTAIWFYSRRNKLNFWLLADLVVVGLSFGQIIGRWGNYFNQEVFGRPTGLPWGIPIDPANRPAEFVSSEYFHPTFLYESLWNLVVFMVLLGWQLARIKKQESRSKNQEAVYGNIFLTYLILYSIGRFLIEFLRLDPMPTLWGIRWAQMMSLFIILFSFWTLIYLHVKIKSKKNKLIFMSESLERQLKEFIEKSFLAPQDKKRWLNLLGQFGAEEKSAFLNLFQKDQSFLYYLNDNLLKKTKALRENDIKSWDEILQDEAKLLEKLIKEK